MQHVIQILQNPLLIIFACSFFSICEATQRRSHWIHCSSSLFSWGKAEGLLAPSVWPRQLLLPSPPHRWAEIYSTIPAISVKFPGKGRKFIRRKSIRKGHDFSWRETAQCNLIAHSHFKVWFYRGFYQRSLWKHKWNFYSNDLFFLYFLPFALDDNLV